MMDDYEDSLDLLDDDGDGVVEMCVMFDEEGKNKQGGSKPHGNSGCCLAFGAIGASFLFAGWGFVKLLA